MNEQLVAVVPAWNEEGAIGRVVDEIRAFDPAATIVVVDDASSDETAAVAEAHGAIVLRLPFNVGIGGAVQTGFRYARDEGYDVAVRLDGDGQHDASELGKLLAPLQAGSADLVIGSRFVDPGGTYRPPFARRIGIRVFARLVSVLGGQRVTDTTSGFVALNRSGIELFAVEYPHDYPEVEATLVARSQRPAPRPGAGRDARASGGHVVDHVRPLALLHRQGHARAARRQPPALPAARGGGSMTPIRASIAGAIASIILILVVVELVRGRRLKERYALLWLATGIVLLVLSVVARRPEHDRRLARRDELSAGRPVRGRDALHLPRAPALLDRDLEAHRRERRPRAAHRAARGAPQPAAATGRLNANTSPSLRVVDPVRSHADPVRRRRRCRCVEKVRLARGRDRLTAEDAVDRDASRDEAVACPAAHRQCDRRGRRRRRATGRRPSTSAVGRPPCARRGARRRRRSA